MATKLEALTVGVIHGPNLNLLGQREPEVYGATTLEELDGSLRDFAAELGVTLQLFQSNNEGALVDRVQELAADVDGFLVNAGALTHTSIALRDALIGVSRPFVEVHLSNVFGRERFRHRSFLSDRAVGVVVGFGPNSYLLGLRGLVDFLRKPGAPRRSRSV